MTKQINIAIFASGSGTNAENLILYFNKRRGVSISALLSNNRDSFALVRAKRLGVESVIFSNKELQDSNIIDDILSKYKIDIIVLAGFLLKVPDRLISKYSDRIINIHPSLLPKYGGKGMYGMNVHKAVICNKESVSGITIHVVNDRYDEGRVLFQAQCAVTDSDTPETLAAKIHLLEQQYFPEIIEKYIFKLLCN